MAGSLKVNSKRALLVILGIAFVLRFVGINHGLPSVYLSAEFEQLLKSLMHDYAILYQSVSAPFLIILKALSAVVYFIGDLFGIYQNHLDFISSFFLAPDFLFLSLRLISVIISVLTIYLFFRFCDRFLSTRVALLAATLLTLSFTVVHSGHWIFQENIATLFTVVTLWSLYAFYTEKTMVRCILAGCMTGIAIAFSSFHVFLVLIFVIAVFMNKDSSEQMNPLFLPVGLFFTALALLILSPAAFLHPDSWWQGFLKAGLKSAGFSGRLMFDIAFSDLTIGLLFIAGLIYVAFKGEKEQLLAVAFALPALVFGMVINASVQKILIIFPVLALLAAIFFNDILSQKFKPALQLVILFLLLIPGLSKIVIIDIRLLSDDTRTEAKDWIERNLNNGSLIAFENYFSGPQLYDPKAVVKMTADEIVLPMEIRESLLLAKTRRISYELVELRRDFKIRALDVTDDNTPETLRKLVQNRLPRLTSVEKAGIDFLIVSGMNYERFLQSPVPERGTPSWVYYENGRSFYKALFSSESWQLINEFKAGFWKSGPDIRIYKNVTTN